MEKLNKYFDFNILKKYFSLNLIAFVSGCLLIVFLTKSSKNSNIKALQQKNDSLMVVNQSLVRSNDSLKTNIDKSTLVIMTLNKKDESLKIKVGQLNNKINSLKDKYEKANNHANDFNAVDIQRYFAELK
jgi:CII-binding regulator of phage lambda lysogenization HflD